MVVQTTTALASGQFSEKMGSLPTSLLSFSVGIINSLLVESPVERAMRSTHKSILSISVVDVCG